MRHHAHPKPHHESQPRDDGGSLADERFYTAVAQRQAFRHSRTSLGATSMFGHWVHLVSMAVPLVIPEITKDPDKRWRALRLATIGTTLASEAVWTWEIEQRRRQEKACREAAAERA